MALEIIQGFDYLTTADLIAEGWQNGGGGQTISSSFSRYAGSQGMQLNGGGTPSYAVIQTSNYAAFTNSAVKVVGMALNIQSGLSAGVVYPFGLVGTSTNCSLLANANGSVSILNSSGTVLATSATGLLAAATWAYVELKSTGSQVICAINGSVACTATLTMGSISRLDIGSREFSTSTAGYTLWVDDFYALNGTGTPNDFLATSTNTPFIQTPTPTAAGNYTQWAANGAATNYGCVSDAAQDGDTTYINDGTVGHRDSYAHSALTGTVSSIVAVDEVMYARLDPAGSGSHSVAQSLRISGADYDATASTLSSSYARYHNLRTVSPATSAAFTTAEVNAMEIGVKVAS